MLTASSPPELPADVLSHIFSFVPLVPRVRSASVVCRRWRSTALRAPISLQMSHFPNEDLIHRCVAHLPGSVVSIPWLPLPRDTELPRLQRIVGSSVNPHHCEPYLRLRSISVMDLVHSGWCNCMPDVIRNNSAALSSLVLSVVPESPMVTHSLSSLASLNMPQLRDLGLLLSTSAPLDNAEVLTSLLRRHAAQLTSLSGEFSSPELRVTGLKISALRGLSYPQLKHATLYLTLNPDDLEFIAMFICATPTLVSLKLSLCCTSSYDYSDKVDEVLAVTAPYLVSFTTPELMQHLRLERCSRLAALHLSHPLPSYDQLASCLARLSALRLRTIPPNICDMCPQLHQLVVEQLNALDHTLFRFPRLHALAFTTSCDMNEVMRFVRALLVVAPRLKRVEVSLTNPPELPEDTAELDVYTKQAERDLGIDLAFGESYMVDWL